MSKLIELIKKLVTFVSEKLWTIRLNKVNKRQGLLIRQLRILSLSFKGFKEDNCLTYASALTVYTLFSIVPVFALIFAISKGFGYEKTLQDQILKNYTQYTEILTNAFVYANSMLANTKGSVIAAFGIVLLLWSVMQLLMNIEDSFNDIWDITRGRSWVRKLTDYLTIMLVGPLLLILSAGITVSLQTKIGNMHMLGFVGTISIKAFAFFLLALVFTFLYMVLPNTKIKFIAAFKAAVIASLFFELLGWVYIEFQIGASRLNAIYGGFAALPLFLIWVQYSWYIVLFGAEVSYSIQNVDNYELEDDIKNLSLRYKRALSLLIANIVAKRFHNQEKALNAIEISLKLDLPSRLTRSLINELIETGIFVEVVAEVDKEIVYVPGVPESKLTVQYIIDTLDKKGVNSLPINDTNELIHIHKFMHELDQSMDTNLGHLHIKDLVI
jgi:membrane protein